MTPYTRTIDEYIAEAIDILGDARNDLRKESWEDAECNIETAMGYVRRAHGRLVGRDE